MKKVLILGCNGITEFIVPRMVDMPAVSEIIIASRDKAECDELRKKYQGKGARITTARVDLENEQGTKMMLSITNPDMIISLVPPKFSLTVMKLALETGADYIDGALYGWEDGDLLSGQFGMFGEFRSAAKMAVVGCGMNPSYLVAIARAAMRDDFDSVDSVDVLEVNLTEGDSTSDDAFMIQDGKRVDVSSSSKTLDLDDNFGEFSGSRLYLQGSPVTMDFLKEIPGVPNVRCFVTREVEEEEDFTEELNKLGMLSEVPVKLTPDFSISPKEFWEKYRESMKKETALSGRCGAGIVITGRHKGEDKTEFIYFTGDNDKCAEEYKMPCARLFDAHAILAGVSLMCSGRWLKAGVFTPAAFDADMFVSAVRTSGLAAETRIIE